MWYFVAGSPSKMWCLEGVNRGLVRGEGGVRRRSGRSRMGKVSGGGQEGVTKGFLGGQEGVRRS